ncbi:metallophosphoesterase family protein [Zooshikella sp. RANM57]|uniref:metallophosphoesterase family protein n=1 Tax=Zooshikella sp. RANM57 TaxID=3425863 RepID=UPI003D6F30CB
MPFEKHLINSIENAYESFKNRVDKNTHDSLLATFEKIHRNIDSLIKGEDVSSDGSEFAHALALLDKVPDDLKELPHEAEELTTRVRPDGELLGVGKWELLDPDWAEAIEQLLLHFDHKAPFNTSPVCQKIPDTVSIAVAGDWGTGNWRDKSPSALVGKQMAKLNPDYTIHLGDVYYAGTQEQEINNLVELWPMGSKGAFTLNSNHEMYSGAIPYFEQALAKRFIKQNGCSYFALENSNWLIVGLDTAYHASAKDLYLKGKLDDTQINWLKTLPTHKRIIVLSHHEGYDIKGVNKGAVYNSVIEGLGREPDFWYWGHLHNAIAYKPKGKFYGRCIGHGSIPYGDATLLKGEDTVAWYENKSANDPDIPLRVLNGFAYITLNEQLLSEKLIAENGDVRFENQGL